jgi:hypothetical protein
MHAGNDIRNLKKKTIKFGLEIKILNVGALAPF